MSGRSSTALHRPPQGVWTSAARRFVQDRVGLASFVVVVLFGLMVMAVAAGLLAADWQRERAVSYAPPWGVAGTPASLAQQSHGTGPLLDLTAVDPLAPRYAEWARRAEALRAETPVLADRLLFGADRLGRDVLAKALRGARTSIVVGVLAALLAALLGTLFGAFAGFFGGRFDDVMEWLYNVFTSIPGILLVLAFAAVTGRGAGGVVLVLGLTGWTAIYRLVRAEFIKHAARDYVRAAQAIGAPPLARMFRHILPNVSHVVLVQLSIHVVGFIKYEVILSYLGLGVGLDEVSWGSMLAESQSELLQGVWWQLATATAFMAVFVTAFSLMTDALRDALDPKLGGLV